jgi:hypothetical protein
MDAQTHRQEGDLISLLLFSYNKDNRLKITRVAFQQIMVTRGTEQEILKSQTFSSALLKL